MTKMNRAEIHVDHGHWQSDIQMWYEDLEAWQKEQAKLLAELELALGASRSVEGARASNWPPRGKHASP